MCLSGGGFRAALFQLGILKRLHEAGLLRHVYAYAATSGGSILATILKLHSDEDSVTGEVQVNWPRVEAEVLRLANRGLLRESTALAIAIGLYVLAWFVHLFGSLLRESACAFAEYTIRSCQDTSYRSWNTWFGVLAIILAATAVAIHAGLAVHLIRRGARRFSKRFARWCHLNGEHAHFARGPRRLLAMLLSPSFLRWQMLNLDVYRDAVMGSVSSALPWLYVTAVDLVGGAEKVFTKGVVATLDMEGTRQLWKQRANYASGDISKVDIAAVVAASSAIPLVFRPVGLGNEWSHIGTFIDGGVLDNLSLNVVRAFSVQIRDENNESIFRQHTELVILADGSLPLGAYGGHRWWRFRPISRIVDVVTNHAGQDADLARKTFIWDLGLEIKHLSLSVGFPEGGVEDHSAISPLVPRIRTHLDSFTHRECASLVYCGYAQCDSFIATYSAGLTKFDGVVLGRSGRTIRDMLPHPIAPSLLEPQELARHLMASDSQSLVWRMLRRWVGRLRARSTVRSRG